MNLNHHNFARQTGFSLMEAVVVIAISGIIVAAVALFIRAPVAGYVDTARRAELTDIADTALRRIGRDLRTALPNSVRVTNVGSVFYLEYLEVRTGGRYRASAHMAISSISVANPTTITTTTAHSLSTGIQVVCINTNSTPSANGTWTITVTGATTFTIPLSVTSSGNAGTCVPSPACPDNDTRVTDDDILSFYSSGAATDTCFKTLGNIPDRAQIVNNDFVVVFNLGIPGADAYESSPNTNKSLISGTSTNPSPPPFEDQVIFAAQTFRLPSPGNRFQVITGPVSYVCDPVGGTLRRYSGYAIQASQPNNAGAPPLSTALVDAMLASHVSACSFTYNPIVVAQRDSLVTMSLSVTEVNSQGQNETITLYEAAHVSNVP